MVEILNALLYVAALWRFGLGWYLLPIFAFCSVMVVITFIDLDFQIIPDILTVSGAIFGLIASSIILPDIFKPWHIVGFKNSLIGIITGGGLFFAIAFIGELLLKKEAMGMGDVKMMGMVGAILGWKGVLLTTFTGSLLGSIIGMSLMRITGKGRDYRIPFGPFLAAGAIVTLFYGKELLSLYLRRPI